MSFNTPKPINFEIYEDTTIDLNQFDRRLNIKLKFNWNYEDYFDIGVNSIDILLNKKIISTINIGEVISLEAFPQKSNKNGRFGDPVRDDIYMQDINFDSYLDLKVRSVCGQGCWYSYWIFNKENNVFERNEDLDSFRPYYFDCKNQIIYSYLGGSAWYHSINAYKVINYEIKFFQSIYKEYRKEYSLQVFRDHNDSIIKVDTIYEN